MSYCQKPFYPPSLNTPGMTIFASYNDSGIATDIFRYKPRCAESDCYIDQCLISGKILWYYIVPSVIGFIILVFIIWLIGCKCCNQNNDYIDKENERERKRKQNLQQKANDRKKNVKYNYKISKINILKMIFLEKKLFNYFLIDNLIFVQNYNLHLLIIDHLI